jgi:hypothetical protein
MPRRAHLIAGYGRIAVGRVEHTRALVRIDTLDPDSPGDEKHDESRAGNEILV